MGRKPTGNRPDYSLSAFNVNTGRSTDVGVGWKKDRGRIKIMLGPCVHLTNEESIVFNLFPLPPRDRDDEYDVAADMAADAGREEEEQDGLRPPVDDEIPF